MNATNTIEPDLLIPKLQEALAQANLDDDPALKCSELMKLGQAYLDKKEAPAALTQFEEALKIAHKMEDKRFQAKLFGFKGLALKMLGNYSAALQAFRKSNGIATRLKHDPLLCDSSFQIGILKSIMGNRESALDDLTRAFEIAARLGDRARELRSADTLADNFYALQTFDKAREYYHLGLELAVGLGNPEAECSLLTKLANVSLAAGEPETAIKEYERALDIASAIESRMAEINILGGLFRANALAGNANLAIIYGEKIIQLSRDIHHFDAEITNIHALANFLVEQGQVSEALAYLGEGQELAEKNQSREWLLTILVDAGAAYRGSGDLQAAVDKFKGALSIGTGIGDKPSIAKILRYLSAIEAERDRLTESIQYAERALEFAQESQNIELAGEQHMLLALNYRDLDQRGKAIQSCQAALASYKEIGTTEMLAKAEALCVELQQ